MWKSTLEKPITAITIVEDISKCPQEYTIITKTQDTDADADLWRDYSIFARKVTRYLCYTKENTIADFVVDNLTIVNDKDLPPEGYGAISKTIDSEQKAWRKKQICFKLSRRQLCQAVITDIILLNRNRKAPDGYHLIGDLNGLFVCVKLMPAATIFDKIAPSQSNEQELSQSLGYYLVKKEPPPPPVPVRPAPSIPVQNNITGSNDGLHGVPFKLNLRLENDIQHLDNVPTIIIKSREDIDKEYGYNCNAEKEISMY